MGSGCLEGVWTTLQGLEDDSIEFEMIFAPGDAGFARQKATTFTWPR
jgi:hypothetical protein